jgi:hypothetical protein
MPMPQTITFEQLQSDPRHDLGPQAAGEILAPAQGDFARGQRHIAAGHARGDFATGMRTHTMLRVAGDFATGMRTSPRTTTLGDFATGMRTSWAPVDIDTFVSPVGALAMAF